MFVLQLLITVRTISVRMVVYAITDAQHIAVHALCASLETCVKYVSIQVYKKQEKLHHSDSDTEGTNFN